MEHFSENFESLLESTSNVRKNDSDINEDDMSWKSWKKPTPDQMPSAEDSRKQAVANQTADLKAKAGVKEEECEECGDGTMVEESDGPSVDVDAMIQQYRLLKREVNYGNLSEEELNLMDGLNRYLVSVIEKNGGHIEDEPDETMEDVGDEGDVVEPDMEREED